MMDSKQNELVEIAKREKATACTSPDIDPSTVSPEHRRLYLPVRRSIKGFHPFRSPIITPIRAWLTSLWLRFMLARGFIVFLVGRCRTGKSYLVGHLTPGRVLDGSKAWSERHGQLRFDPANVPAGVFAIDEAIAFERRSMLSGLRQLANRSFVLTAPSVGNLDALGVGALLQSLGRRILVVELK